MRSGPSAKSAITSMPEPPVRRSRRKDNQGATGGSDQCVVAGPIVHNVLIGRGKLAPPKSLRRWAVSAALRGRSGPALDERIIVDRLAFRLFVCQLRLRSDVPVLLRLVEPELRALLLIE